VVITALVFFVAGSRSDQILAQIGPSLGIKVDPSTLDLSSLQETYRQLKANYDGDIKNSDLIDGANKGLVAAAGDQYTVYMTAEEAKAFEGDLSGDIGGGIGAEIGMRNDAVSIVRVLADNPAEKAGLKAGDRIVAVNEESSVDWTVEETVAEIRGEAGTTVKVSVLRGGETLDFTITRAEVSNPSVTSRVENGVGIIKIYRFDGENGETVSLARQAAVKLKQQKVRGIVLDLRSNTGGHVQAAEGVAGLWLDDEVIMTERRAGRTVKEYRSGSNPLLASLPTVVLINGSSASASEIVAGALKDHGKATLVGEKSFGKGSMQTIIDLSRDAILKVTTARWYTPSGINITKTGIEPDKKVELTVEDVNADRDPQIEAAISRLTS